MGRLKTLFKNIFGAAIAGVGIATAHTRSALKSVFGEAVASSRYVSSELLKFGKFAGVDGLGAVSALVYPKAIAASTKSALYKNWHEVALPNIKRLHQNAVSLTSPSVLQSPITHNTHTAQAISLAPQSTFNFSFNVAGGTTQEQARSMAEMIEDTVNKMQHKQYTHALSTFTNKE